MIDGTSDIISLSKEIKEQLYQGLQQKKHLQVLDITDRFVKTTSLSHRQIFDSGQVNQPMAIISQLGTLDFASQYGDITIERVYGLFNWRGCFVHEDTFIITGAIFDQQLMGMFACIEPLVSRDDAQQMADYVKALLLN